MIHVHVRYRNANIIFGIQFHTIKKKYTYTQLLRNKEINYHNRTADLISWEKRGVKYIFKDGSDKDSLYVGYGSPMERKLDLIHTI